MGKDKPVIMQDILNNEKIFCKYNDVSLTLTEYRRSKQDSLYNWFVIRYNYNEVMKVSDSNIIYLENKKSGTVYAYEDKPYWDPEKKQSRSKRKLVGKVDPATGNIIPTRRRKLKGTPMEREENPPCPDAALPTVSKVLMFLRLFMCETIAKRVVGMVMIAVGVPEGRVAELLGLCAKSVNRLRKGLEDGGIDGMFHVAGGGRKRKLGDLEGSIIEEIDNNNYHSHQQIADIIQEKYGIKVSLPVIGRLLKKTGSGG